MTNCPRISAVAATAAALVFLLVAPPAAPAADSRVAEYRVTYGRSACVARIAADTTPIALLFARVDVRGELTCPNSLRFLSSYVAITDADGQVEKASPTTTCRNCRHVVSEERLVAIGPAAHKIVLSVGAFGQRRWTAIAPTAGSLCTGFATTVLNCRISLVTGGAAGHAASTIPATGVVSGLAK
jgi:hypothetical protein